MARRILENDHLKIGIDDLGAELVSVFDRQRGQERIWSADPGIWNRHAPILFPFVGKVNGGVYRYQGKTYEMKKQHGFARDMEFTCVKDSGTEVVHCLRDSEATRAVYPFSFELYVTHRLRKDNDRILEIGWEIRNCGHENMYYSIGGHPAFMMPASEGCFLKFEGKECLNYILINPAGGLAVPDVRYPLTLNDGVCPVTKDMFDRDALIFEEGQVSEVSILTPARIPWVTLQCEGFPYLGVWSKRGAPFVCLEPWVGRTDDDGFCGDLSEKTGERCLEAGKKAAYFYSVVLW